MTFTCTTVPPAATILLALSASRGDSLHYAAAGIWGTDSHIYVVGHDTDGIGDGRVYVHDRSTGAYSTDTVIVLDPNITEPWDLFIADGYLYVMQRASRKVFAHDASTGATASSRDLQSDPSSGVLDGVDYDGRNTYYLTRDHKLLIVPGLTSGQ